MLHSIKDREGLEDVNELVSLQNEVQELRLRDKLCKQKYHYDWKKKFGPMTDLKKKTPLKI